MDTGMLVFDTLLETMENIAFLDLEPDPAGSPAEISAAASFLVELDNVDAPGKLSLMLDKDLAGELTQNFLGEIPPGEDTLEVIRDAVGELANIVAGNLWPRLHGGTMVRLGVPRVQMLSAGEFPESWLSEETFWFLCEGHPLAVNLKQE